MMANPVPLVRLQYSDIWSTITLNDFVIMVFE